MTIPNSLIICRKEFSEIFRDNRSLLQLFGMPLAFCPVIVCMFFSFERQSASDVWILICQFLAAASAFLNVPIGVSITTGEKERRTIETTLTLCASRNELVIGKYLTIALTNSILSITMLFSAIVAYFISNKYFSNQAHTYSDQFFLKILISYIIFCLFYSILLPSLVLVIGLIARNNKEATGWANALFMILAALPAVATILQIKLTIFTVLIPVVNCNLFCQQFFLNSTVEWYLWLMFFYATIVYTWISIQFSIKLIKADAMLTPP